MEPSTVTRATIHVLGRHGYVWSPEESHWLRLECGLVGAMVGGVAGFKQQNAVHGLPLQLGADEVTLALERGWAALAPALDVAAAAAAAAVVRRQPKRRSFHDVDSDDEGADQDMAAAPAEPPPWQGALGKKGVAFTIPVAAAASVAGAAAPAAAAADAEAGGPAAGAPPPAGEAAAEQAGVPAWDYPATEAERHRYWVFRDLHQQGYRITGGSKFGSDFLLYPGDPTLFHAQFCVRLLPLRAPLLPPLLAAACRGSHQARKHLLLASVEEGAAGAGAGAGAAGEALAFTAAGDGTAQQGPPGAGKSDGEGYRVHYMTIGPVEGFG